MQDHTTCKWQSITRLKIQPNHVPSTLNTHKHTHTVEVEKEKNPYFLLFYVKATH